MLRYAKGKGGQDELPPNQRSVGMGGMEQTTQPVQKKNGVVKEAIVLQ